MPEVVVLSETELRQHIKLDHELIDVIEKAFNALSNGGVIMPPIMSMDLSHLNAEVDAKTAYIPGFDSFALKVSTAFFDNHKRGFSNLNGMMTLYSATTGVVEALLMDNGYLTDIRTAAAGAIAAKHMAPEQVDTVGVIGTGLQARLQIEAAYLVRPFKKVLVWGRNHESAEHCAADISKTIGVETIVSPDCSSLVGESQLVVTTTTAREPLISVDMLHPGLHITAMGSDAHYKNEIEPKALVAADNYICDSVKQCEVLGELRVVKEQDMWTAGDPVELGDVTSGKSVARKNEDEITICDLTGTGAQDTAIATHALSVCAQKSIGQKINI